MTPFKRKRVAAGLSQEELAKKLGVTDGAVGQWERGEATPGPRHVPKLAKIFQMKPERVTHLFDPVPAS